MGLDVQQEDQQEFLLERMNMEKGDEALEWQGEKG